MPSAFDVPHAAAEVFREFPAPWGVCGGWAIDLFLDRQTRPHNDIEVAVLRRDQLALRSLLAKQAWVCEKIIKGKHTPWAENEWLDLPVHEVQCSNVSGALRLLEILLNESDGPTFRFRRDPAITMSLESAFLTSACGLPILAPEVVLLYKASDPDAGRNALDFDQALPHLDSKRRAWLVDALRKRSPFHPWINRLKTPG